jgi:hypothetical protein
LGIAISALSAILLLADYLVGYAAPTRANVKPEPAATAPVPAPTRSKRPSRPPQQPG